MNKLELHSILQVVVFKYDGMSDEKVYSMLDFVDKKYVQAGLKLYAYLMEVNQ